MDASKYGIKNIQKNIASVLNMYKLFFLSLFPKQYSVSTILYNIYLGYCK